MSSYAEAIKLGPAAMDAMVEDSRDYLLDPELWLDKLPQPYRLVDDVLQGFLDEVWAAIERREVCKRGEEGRVKIPELSGSRLLPGSQGTTIVRYSSSTP